MLFPSTMIGKKDGGFVLVTAILLLAVMVLVGTAVLTQTSIESKITGNLRSDRTAFFNAEAGVQYTLEKLKQDFGAGVLLPSGSSIALSYAAPAGFSCTLPTTLTALGSNRYRFQVSGNSPDGSTAAIEVELTTAAKSAFQQGLFGDLLVDLKSSSGVYSFDSRVTPHPNPADYPGASTNKADVGSNGEVRVYMDTYIDGSVMLGDNGAGTEAVLTSTGVPIINGTPGIDIPRVNPDPLGALDPTSTLGQKFQDVITNNDNNTVPGLTGNTSIDLGNGETMTLTAGDYFLTDIVLRNGSILEIDATGGPVNIYLSGTLDTEDGELEAKNGSQINNQSLPTDFYIYSNSSQSIILKHGSDLSGMVYAPNAPVEIRNSGDVYGLVWGKTIDIKNSGQYFFDIAFKDKFTSNNYDINVASWKDTRYKRN